MRKHYEYRGIEAASYDFIDELADFEDYAFYRFLIELNPGPVLDLGCGTGRILLPPAEEGIDVMGIYVSDEMLEICRAKLLSSDLDASLARADIRHFQLGRTFGTLLIPGFTFQLLLEPDEMEGCLESCLRHLEPTGQLVISTYLPLEMLESGLEEKPLGKKRVSEPDVVGERFVAWQGWEIDRIEQLLRLNNRFQRLDSKGAVKSEESRQMALRWHLPYDMQQLLRRMGFSDISVYGDFIFEPPDAESESLIYVARR